MNYRPLFHIPAPVIFGCGAVAAVADKIRELGCRKPLIVTDKGIAQAGVVKKLTDVLDAAGISYVVFDDGVSDPPASVADAAGAAAISAGADCLIGLGGGSSMDAAKATAIYMLDPGEVKRYIEPAPIKVETQVPVILVPTTAGTGSECTSVAVISRPELNKKWSVFVNTTCAIVDPELTFTLPPYETANTGLDALSHAIESLTVNQWNYHSDLFAEGAIRKIWKNLYTAYSEPQDLAARSEMALAANWAGMAFNNPITHVGHSIADALSCEYHTPHGLGCALALPEVVTMVAPPYPDRVRTIANAMELKTSGNETAEQLGTLVAEEIRALMHRMNVPSLKSLGYDRETVLSLAQEVVDNHLSTFSPVEITPELAAKLLANVYDLYQ